MVAAVFGKLGVKLPEGQVHVNLSSAELVEHAIRYQKGANLSADGALVVTTGKHTGRSANDKYAVKTQYTTKSVDWSNNVHEMTPQTYRDLKEYMLDHLNKMPRLYISQRSVGAQEGYVLGVNLLSPSPSHAFFVNNMFRDPAFDLTTLGEFNVIHAPHLEVPIETFKTRSTTAIVLNMDEKEVLVCGSQYAGEIKKSIFSAMNFLLPELNVLPTHSGANIDDDGNVSLFFGLSGTGKTTLSTDDGKYLIGDDEHGICPQGTFNFEGGCYAKTFKLNYENEPQIYKACRLFGTLLENVVLDEQSRLVDFDDGSLTENGRASYPLSHIDDAVSSARGAIPSNMFFLSADAFGVLPAVAKLNPNQAMYYFLSGYTAKLAGTEIGVVEPSATFSHCFGAPFMMRDPQEYARLLKHYMDKHHIKVWLINTGWTGGAYGTGHRFPILVTRNIIRSVQAGKVDESAENMQPHPIFGFEVPKKIDGVDEEHLFPWKSWGDEKAYYQQAEKLASMFNENFKKYTGLAKEILAGGPKLS